MAGSRPPSDHCLSSKNELSGWEEINQVNPGLPFWMALITWDLLLSLPGERAEPVSEKWEGRRERWGTVEIWETLEKSQCQPEAPSPALWVERSDLSLFAKESYLFFFFSSLQQGLLPSELGLWIWEEQPFKNLKYELTWSGGSLVVLWLKNKNNGIHTCTHGHIMCQQLDSSPTWLRWILSFHWSGAGLQWSPCFTFFLFFFSEKEMMGIMQRVIATDRWTPGGQGQMGLSFLPRKSPCLLF